jgi:hypothetical protein
VSGIGNLGLGGRRSTVRVAVVGSILLTLVGVSVGLMQEAHAADSPSPELPNLVADPPDDVSLGVDSSAGSERLLLRFNGYIQNVGPGALDFRGSRAAPSISKKVEEEVETAKEDQTELPQRVEEELASPRMNVSQRLFTTNQPENDVERPHVEEPSPGEMVYVNADGHHHWHLQHVARYSLWNAAKTAEVAPAQKVGFCLDDSQHVEEGVGPVGPVYSAAGQSFCQRYNPDATSVYQGISAGWRDIYPAGIAFQWVDVSDVVPGEYWIREDVNPDGVVKEEGGANAPAYSASPVIIPGFDAQARSLTISTEGPHEVTLSATAWGDTDTPAYSVLSQPLHGKLGTVEGNHVTYTPTPGYSGPDSFTYAAADPASPFPLSPAAATVSIEDIGSLSEPSVTILGAPVSMQAGTSVQLSASVIGSTSDIRWHATASTITGQGLYTAPTEPPASGTETVTARLSRSHKVVDHVSIAITPATAVPGAAPLAGKPLAGTPGDARSRVGARRRRRRALPRSRRHQNASLATVAISGAPSRMIAGTGVQLTANTTRAVRTLTWTASAGSFIPEGRLGRTAVYRAPSDEPPGTRVTIRARPRGERAVSYPMTVTIVAVPSDLPATEAPASELSRPPDARPSSSSASNGNADLGDPTAMLSGRQLVMTTASSRGARISLDAFLGRRLLGGCSGRVAGGQTFTCRLAIGPHVPTSAPVRVLASARIGRRVEHRARTTAPVQAMRMPGVALDLSEAAETGSWRLLCTPPTRQRLSEGLAHP